MPALHNKHAYIKKIHTQSVILCSLSMNSAVSCLLGCHVRSTCNAYYQVMSTECQLTESVVVIIISSSSIPLTSSETRTVGMDEENETAVDMTMTDWQWPALNDTGQLCVIQSSKNSPYNGKAYCTSLHSRFTADYTLVVTMVYG